MLMRTACLFGLLTCYALHDTDWITKPGIVAIGILSIWAVYELTALLKRRLQ